MSHIAIISASVRDGRKSHNVALHLERTLKATTNTVDLLDLGEFDFPLFHERLKFMKEPPAKVLEFAERIRKAEGVIIVTPEYNGSIPGTLKNALDWASRAKPNPLDKKPVLLLGASPGALGAVRGLWHTRVPLEALGAFVYPQMHGLSKAHEAFDDAGQLRDSKAAEQLMKLLQTFVQFANATNSTGK